MKSSTVPWYRVENINEINSPAILIYPERVEHNIRKMIEIAGKPERLRPHVKTHKMPEIIKLQMKYGITKFKSATIPETEMVAGCGTADILLAMQPVGPNLERFFRLRKEFANSSFSCIADNIADIGNISEMAVKTGMETRVWLDINVGMNRTGAPPGKESVGLFKKIMASPMLVAGGLHVYDGHIHEADLELRTKKCSDAFAPVAEMIKELEKQGINVKIVAGGTPTFPIHAGHNEPELSPGTMLLWDYGYGQAFSDLEFLHAAVLLTRVVSKPAPGLLCIDLGHKAVASEMPQPRVKLLDLTDYQITGHSEEHMVIRTPEADKYKTGDVLYGIPWHICPTIDRHDKATVIRNNRAEGEWNIEARRRKIKF